MPKMEEILELRQTLVDLLADINQQIVAVHQTAEEMGIEPYQLRSHDGSWVLIPLQAAKAQTIHAYILLLRNMKE